MHVPKLEFKGSVGWKDGMETIRLPRYVVVYVGYHLFVDIIYLFKSRHVILTYEVDQHNISL